MSEFAKFLKAYVAESIGDLPPEVQKNAPEGDFKPGDLDPSVFQKDAAGEAEPEGGSGLRKAANIAGTIGKAALEITDPLFGGATIAKAAKQGFQKGISDAGHVPGSSNKAPSKTLSPIDRAFLIAWLYSTELKDFALRTGKSSKGILAVQNFLKQFPTVPKQQALVDKLNLQSVADTMFSDLDLTALAQSFSKKQPGSAYSDALENLRAKYA